MPDMLREVEVKVLHKDTCGKMLSGYPWDRKTDTMLCAGGEDKVRKWNIDKKVFLYYANEQM